EGRPLKDEQLLETLEIKNSKLYFKDLGPQIGWKTVFLIEYAGPFFLYPIFYLRPGLIYGEGAASKPYDLAVQLALIGWTIHYGKRLLETLFIHRFSHATMPIGNLAKNCSYYWGFAAFIAYFVNHPLYTSPKYGTNQIYGAFAGFLLMEYGNLVIHCLLRDLRPPGTKERKIPYSNSNPMSILQNFVSCPNYTYEVGTWFFFSVMTQCLAVVIFMFLGLYQMTVWAIGKHRNYKREFKNYPRRKAILPFII
ncbi:uncharacterized protein TRIADDRAFT_29423, partial [Trichoplax adhaerens]